jgi:competence protein ComEC
VTPAAIAGALLGIDWPLQVAHFLFFWLARALHALSDWQLASLEWPAPSMWAVVLAMFGLGWLAAPRGIPGRWAGLAFLAPLLLTTYQPPPAGSFRATVFDAGQGMAVLVETSQHQLVYDTGPRYGEDADAGTRVLVPHLRAIGMSRLDTLVVSHRDLDHAGGAVSLLASRKVDRLLTSIAPGDRMLPTDVNGERCEEGQRWEWDGVTFTMLHPAAEDYDHASSTNARSCVLKVQTGNRSLLLAGDIEAPQERALLSRETQSVLHATALLVPHHGSLTSSTQGFVGVVHPEIAIVQAGWHNRFGHPRAEVLARYEDIGSKVLRTDADGQLVLRFGPEDVQYVRWREENPRYWQGR